MAVSGGRTAAVDEQPPAAAGRWRGRWPAVVSGLVGGLLAVLMRDAVYDDALILWSFARNLVDDGCWCLAAGLEVNTATSPAAVLLYAALYAVTGSVVAATVIVTAGCFAVVAWWVQDLSGARGARSATTWAALLAVGLLATAPVVTQAVGMESLLGVVVLLALARYGLAGRWWPVAAAVGVSPLVRPDLLVGALAALAVVAAARRQWRAPAAAAVGGALLAAAWGLWSWWRFGSPWPDTVAVKASMGGWGADGSIHFAGSWVYMAAGWPLEVSLTAGVVGLGALAAVLAARSRRWAPAVLAVGGLSNLTAMLAAASNPTTYYAAIAAGACACAVAVAAPTARVVRAGGGVLLAAGAVWLVFSASSIAAGYHPWRLNGATTAQYAAIAAGLPRDAVVLSDEIGALTYFCRDRGCRVVDPYLADPGRVAQRVQAWRAQHPVLGWALAQRPVPRPAAVTHRLVISYPGSWPGWPVTGSSRLAGTAALQPGAD